MRKATEMPRGNEDTRAPDHEIAEPFFARWSPRAFTGEDIPERTLLGLFEAARWAPSAMNAQPWRFVYARRGSPAFEKLLSALVPANQAWASKASALVAILSERTMRLPKGEVVPSASHSFDAGAAWAQMALQAHLWGWSTHAMGGFDREVARQVLAAPDDHAIEVIVAVGKRGDPSTLPDWARSREKPNDRLPLSAIVREGTFTP
jgi:nitroreductase